MGWTPLLIATSAGHQPIVEYLVSKGADINAVNTTGHSALHYAASKDRLPIADYLIQSGCHINLRDKLNQVTNNKQILQPIYRKLEIKCTQISDHFNRFSKNIFLSKYLIYINV